MRKIAFGVITLFWVTMNALLWRSEFAGKEVGAATPVSLVWDKILTSPDDSGLAINSGGERIGYCRWSPNIGEEAATGKTANENADIEGRVKRLTGYTIHVDGNFILPENAGRVRFDLDAKFAANHEWIEWTAKATQKPNAWKLSANRKAQAFELELGDGPGAWKQTFNFKDLQEPQKISDALGITAAITALAGLAGSMGENSKVGGTNSPALALGLKWEARQDSLDVGHSRVRVYRLEAHLLDRFQAVVMVSRVGEILRVELPGEVTLINEALINL
jgi:hypothetical protein